MKILAIINPISGNRNVEVIKRSVSEKLISRNIEFEIVETAAEYSATAIARDALKKGIKLIVCIGGDGTIRQITNAIAGTDCCLGIIPTGTGNLLATALGIPNDINKAKVTKIDKPKMDNLEQSNPEPVIDMKPNTPPDSNSPTME